MKIVNVPFSGGGKGKTEGCEKAFNRIREVLSSKSIECVADVVDVDNSNINLSHSNIFDYFRCLGYNDLVFAVGGDHSISYSVFKGFSNSVLGDIGYIVFDAHLDMNSGFEDATHDNYLRVLIESEILNSKNCVLVGVRVFTKYEVDFLKKRGIFYFDMNKIMQLGVEEICSVLMERVRSFDNLYLSVDIDVVDGGMAPGTGYCESGGLLSRELLYFLGRLKNLKNLKVIDLVEINPDKDVNDLTVNLGANILEVFMK